MVSRLVVCVWATVICPIWAWTAKDEHELLSRGNARVLLGALIGDTSTYRQGISEGGEVNALLTPMLGEKILKLGRPIVDFPVMPALHLCCNFGDRAHLNTIWDMVSKHADPHEYRIPDPSILNDYGFAPAFMYTLGLGFQVPPNHQHAAVLQRMIVDQPESVNTTVFEEYIKLTGNPPLSHIPAIFGFHEGLYVLLVDLKWNPNERDEHGLTPLHVAAWFGDAMTVALLLTHGAERVAADNHGRIPLHYAAMRGHADVIELLFIPPVLKGDQHARNKGVAKHSKLKRTMLNARDKDQRTPLMLAGLTPVVQPSVRAIRREMTKEKILPSDRWNRPPLQGKRLTSEPEGDPNDLPGMVGGWPQRIGSESVWLTSLLAATNHDDSKSDIDVIQANTISKGVFKRDYFSAQRPVLFSGQLMAGQPIWAFWRRSELLTRYGDLELLCGPALHGKAASLGVYNSLAENGYVDRDGNGNGDSISYVPPHRTSLKLWAQYALDAPVATGSGTASLTDESLNGPWESLNLDASSATSLSEDKVPIGRLLRGDVLKPKIMQLCGSVDESSISLSAGLAGQGIPMHSGNASWSLLLFGKKKWFLSPPGVNASEPGLLTKTGPVQPTAQWLKEHAPSLRSKGLLYETTQLPGEVLYVPHGWNIASLNLMASVSFSQEFCSIRHTDLRVQRLGAIIYGGNDTTRGLGRTKHHYQRLQFATLGDKQRSKIPQFAFDL